MQTTLDIDLAMIVTALAPTIAVIVAAIIAGRAAVSGGKKLDGIHALVNSAMTEEKRIRLDDLRAQKIVLERVLGDEMSEDHLQLLVNLEDRIADLQRELDHRDKVAVTVKGFSKTGDGT